MVGVIDAHDVIAGQHIAEIRADQTVHAVFVDVARGIAAAEGIGGQVDIHRRIGQRVIDEIHTGIAVERIGAFGPHKGVAACAAVVVIVTRAAVDQIVAVAAIKRIIVIAAVERVIANAAGDAVKARAAVEAVVAVAARDRVISGAAIDGVIARARIDHIRAGARQNAIRAAVAKDRIVACARINRIVARHGRFHDVEMHIRNPDGLGVHIGVAVRNADRRDGTGDLDKERSGFIGLRGRHVACGDGISDHRGRAVWGEGNGDRIARRINRGDGDHVAVVACAPIDIVDAKDNVFNLVAGGRSGRGGKIDGGGRCRAVALACHIEAGLLAHRLGVADIDRVGAFNRPCRVVVAVIRDGDGDIHFAGVLGDGAGHGRAIGAHIRPVQAFAADLLGGAIAFDDVIAIAAGDAVGVRAARQRIRTVAAVQRVGPVAACDAVVAGAADDGIAIFAAVENVIAAAAVDVIVARTAIDRIGAIIDHDAVKIDIRDPDALCAVQSIGVRDGNVADRTGDFNQRRAAQITGIIARVIGGDRIARNRIATAQRDDHINRIAVCVQRSDGNNVAVVARAPVDIVDPEGDILDRIVVTRLIGGKVQRNRGGRIVAIAKQEQRGLRVKVFAGRDILRVAGFDLIGGVVVAVIGHREGDIHHAGILGETAGKVCAVAALQVPLQGLGGGKGAVDRAATAIKHIVAGAAVDPVRAEIAIYRIIAFAARHAVRAAARLDHIVAQTGDDRIIARPRFDAVCI